MGAYGRVRAIDHSLKRCKVSNSKSIHPTRDGRPVPRGTLPAGKGGFPAPPRAVGRGGFPAPPRKNDQNRGEVAGQNKGRVVRAEEERGRNGTEASRGEERIGKERNRDCPSVSR